MEVVLISQEKDDLKIEVVVDVNGADYALKFADVVDRPCTVRITKLDKTT